MYVNSLPFFDDDKPYMSLKKIQELFPLHVSFLYIF